MRKQLTTATLAGLLAACTAAAMPPGAARATFVVHCYDVGAVALQGQPGVLAVERGWHALQEVDRVVYDPAKVSVGQLERRLKEAGTYVRTLEEEDRGHAPEERSR